MTRRVVRTLVIAAVLGAATNVLVVAWCVWMVSVPAESWGVPAYWSRGERSFIIRLDRTPGKAVFRWQPSPPAGEPAQSGIGTPFDPPRWANLDVELRTSENMAGQMMLDTSGPVRYEIAYGWPWLCCRGGVLDINWRRPAQRHDFGPSLEEHPGNAQIGLGAEPRTTPLAPMWAGLAGNVTMFGAAWWLALVVPGTWRRWKRRRHGACIECGYDRRGLGAGVCPECGVAVGDRVRTGPPACAGGSDPAAAKNEQCDAGLCERF